MSKHTPGPWTADVESGTGDYVVWGPGPPGSKTAFVANIGTSPGEPIAFDVAKANARLIAAAPEMLAALKELREVIHHDCGLSEREHLYGHLFPASLRANDAIARAEGREP